MGIAAEVPSGQALRQGEGYNHFAPFVGAELGIEEGCFGKVGAEVGIGLEGFGGIHHFFFKQDIVRRRRYTARPASSFILKRALEADFCRTVPLTKVGVRLEPYPTTRASSRISMTWGISHGEQKQSNDQPGIFQSGIVK